MTLYVIAALAISAFSLGVAGYAASKRRYDLAACNIACVICVTVIAIAGTP